MRFSTRLILLMVLLVAATAAAVAALAYRNITSDSVPRGLRVLEYDVRQWIGPLDATVQAARADISGYAQLPIVAHTLAAAEDALLPRLFGADEDALREQLSGWFAVELSNKPRYAQIRIILAADNGREYLRVDRVGPDGKTLIWPRDALQQKGDRPYVVEGLKMNAGGVHISRIELNQEYGKVQEPHVPTIHITTPLHLPSGKVFGLIVVNLDLRVAFDRIRKTADPGTAQYLVNDQGDYLMHPDRSREFGFDLGRRYRIQDDFPTFAAGPAGKAVSRTIEDRDGRRFGLAEISQRLASDGPLATVVKTQAYNELVAPVRPLQESVLIAGIVATLAAAAIAIVLARTLSRPLAQITTAAEAFAQGQRLALPTGAPGEVGLLVHAFRRMADQVDERTETVRRNAELLDKTIASIADAVLVVDRSGKIVFTNPACRALFGNRDDVGSEDWQRGYLRFLPDGVTPLPPEHSPIGRAVVGESFDAQELILRRVGETKDNHIVASGRPIRDAGGNFDGAVIVYRDVTEARETERQLRQAQKLEAIGQLTGGVAHDFNNILTVIIGTASVLEDQAADRPALADGLKRIDRAAMRGADLTHNLLAVARRQPLRPRKVDINALVKDASTLLRSTLGEDVDIRTSLEADAAAVTIDPSQLTTALLNLALNARDAMPGGGKLTMETGNVVLDEAYAHANADVVPGAYVLVAVSDTGQGMSPELVERVFEPFFTTKEAGKGTGLGLSMVYGFIKQSRGHIKIYSEPGHGTTIKMYLPTTGDTTEAAVDEPAAPTAAARRATILVVEDDALVRHTVVQQLQSMGYAVVVATNGPQAMALAEQGTAFDLLFTDVIMPGGMNGPTLAQAVQRLRPGVPVLYTSGYTENAIVHQGRLDPGVHLLQKPYRKTDLARALRAALDGAPA